MKRFGIPTLIAIALPALSLRSANAQTLAPVESRLVEHVRSSEKQAVAFLEQVVNIGSGTLNIAGVRATGAAFDRELRALGFETRWVEMPGDMRRAGHLFAERRGRRFRTGKRILLLGHLDTVFEGESAKFVQRDTVADGAGTSDMKGGNVAILSALKALAATGVIEETSIIVALMGDEEKPGEPASISRASLVDAAKRSDIALAFEGDAGKGTIARRGIGSWRLEVTARQAHSSGIFRERTGYGAIYEASRIINTFREKLVGEQYLTFNPGIVAGGTTVQYDTVTMSATTTGKINIIAPRAVVEGDLRYLSRKQELNARARMTAIATTGNLPGTSASITFSDGTPSMPPTPGNMRVLQTYDSVSRALGMGPVEALDPGLRGGGDISYIAEYLDALDGLGVIGSGEHTPTESVQLPSMRRAAERAAVLIYRLSRQTRARSPGQAMIKSR